jgi:catechol 2,3-dioxygenase-like lactoylglutathione lyase family enzyme
MGVLGINHIALRTPDVAALKPFYAELMAGEPLQGEHEPLRVGTLLLVFFPSDGRRAEDPDELAFDVDEAGFEDVLARARRMDVLAREPVEPTPWSKTFLVYDPDGRRLEFTHDDHGVFWRE